MAVVVQINQDVRAYLPFISKIGSVLDNSLAALTGETALVTYNDEVTLTKSFGEGDLQTALRSISPSGSEARLTDAGLFALELLNARSGPRSRILLFVGQSIESGSEGKITTLTDRAEQEGVQIYALKLPIFGGSFVSDTFRLQGLGSQGYRGGYQASIELSKAIPAARHAEQASLNTDPFSVLTNLTGGFVVPFRRQRELENAVLALGDALRSRYFLSFVPTSNDDRSHQIKVQVSQPDRKVYARSEYRLPPK